MTDAKRGTGLWENTDSTYDAEAGLMLFNKRIDRLRNPRNDQIFQRMVLESVDWVIMVAIDRAARCVMIRQYRFGVGYTTLETPGGMVDPGEDSRAAAARELLDETGYASDKWAYLGVVEPNPAFHNHLCDVHPIGRQLGFRTSLHERSVNIRAEPHTHTR